MGNRTINAKYLELLMDTLASEVEQAPEYRESAKMILSEIQQDSFPTDLGYSLSVDLIDESLCKCRAIDLIARSNVRRNGI